MVKGSKQEMLVARAKAPLGLNFFSHDYLCAESTPLHILGLWGGGGGGRVGSRDKASRAESTASWRTCLPMFVVSLFLLPVISIFTRDLVNWPCNDRNPSTRSFERVSALTRGKFSWPMQGAVRLFFFFLTRNIPVALISVFRNRDIWHSSIG